MEYSPSFVDGLQADIKPSYSDSLMHEFDDKKYGLPRAKKYPMPDIAHVRSAIKFFNYVDRAHEKELAKAILARMREYGIDPSDVNVGDTNRFKKYLPQTELKHHGIKGMHWGVRRYQNPDGSLTPKGASHYRKSKLYINGQRNKNREMLDHNRKVFKTAQDMYRKNPTGANRNLLTRAKAYVDSEELFDKKLSEIDTKGYSFRKTKKLVKQAVKERNRAELSSTVHNPYVI